jgi:hypothetical protein
MEFFTNAEPKDKFMMCVAAAATVFGLGLGAYDRINHYDVQGVVEHASVFRGITVVTLEGHEDRFVFSGQILGLPEIGDPVNITSNRAIYQRLGSSHTAKSLESLAF